MTGHDYNIALFVFFVPYILFEVPSNIIIKRVAPSTCLSAIMTLWGSPPSTSRMPAHMSTDNEQQELRQLARASSEPQVASLLCVFCWAYSRLASSRARLLRPLVDDGRGADDGQVAYISSACTTSATSFSGDFLLYSAPASWLEVFRASWRTASRT